MIKAQEVMPCSFCGAIEPSQTLELLAHLDTLRAEVERLQAKLRRIEYVAECGSVQSWLALPDKEKARWFGLHLEQDSERLRLRNALRKVIVAAGGMAGPDVSTEFLEQAPLEVMALRGEKERLHMLNGLPSEDGKRWERIARYLVRVYVISDDAYDPQAAAEKAIARLLEQHK